MFNFKELKLNKREDSENTSSFVGIRRNRNNELEFRLPKGFENFPEGDFDATKQLFFKMYRTFKKFEQDKTHPPIDERPAGKDNIETMGNAYRFMDKEDNEVLLYSKISVIENLLEAYQDLALDVIERRVGRNEKIDYSKIDQYLHKAIYLDKDVIYLDEMELPRHILRYKSATLIDLFCFILHELEIELEQESDERVKDLANRFKEQHLSYDQSLFNEETFENTITTLKDILDDIDKFTAYKDEDYWQLYEAIECFLYGELDMENTHEDGVFWGIQDFWSIWEDMCNTYAFANFDVVYADTNIIFNGEPVANATFGGHNIFVTEGFENPFFIDFRGEKRWMRPDLIINKRYKQSFDINEYLKDRLKITDKGNQLIDIEVLIIEIEILNGIENDFLLYSSLVGGLIIESPSSSNYSKLLFRKYTKFKLNQVVQNLSTNDKQIIHRYLKKGFNYLVNLSEKVIKSTDNKGNTTREVIRHEIQPEKLNQFTENLHDFLNNSFIYSCHIFDYKYMDGNDFKEKNSTLDTDITKQICYEFCLKELNLEKIIKSQFIIPYFYKNEELIKLEEKFGYNIDNQFFYSRLQENKIEVFKANFQLIQDVYLNHD